MISIYFIVNSPIETTVVNIKQKALMDKTNENDSGCYCHLWETQPEIFQEQGVPRGYCGLCDALIKGKECGKPGHLRQGNGPYSFCLCDEHYDGGNGFNPIRVGCNIFFALLLLGILWLIIKFVF
jgi:hypothetical protein